MSKESTHSSGPNTVNDRKEDLQAEERKNTCRAERGEEEGGKGKEELFQKYWSAIKRQQLNGI